MPCHAAQSSMQHTYRRPFQFPGHTAHRSLSSWLLNPFPSEAKNSTLHFAFSRQSSLLAFLYYCHLYHEQIWAV